MRRQTIALILVDSGIAFDELSNPLLDASKLVGVCSCNGQSVSESLHFEPAGLPTDALKHFAQDPPVRHMAGVLGEFLRFHHHNPATLGVIPDVHFMLVQGINRDNHVVRSTYDGSHDGVGLDGWTRAVQAMAAYCNDMGWPYVVHCSFGGLSHAAMDGTIGTEGQELQSALGPGGIAIAAAGPGDDRAAHGSWRVVPGETFVAQARQSATTTYTIWIGPGSIDWELDVRKNGRFHARYRGGKISLFPGNGRQKLTFTVDGAGEIAFRTRTAGVATEFHGWIVSDGTAQFMEPVVDPDLVYEPAAYPFVVSVGRAGGKYLKQQDQLGFPPDILVPGEGYISQLSTHATWWTLCMLAQNPRLNPDDLRKQLLDKQIPGLTEARLQFSPKGGMSCQ